MLVAGGKGECGGDSAAVGKTNSVNKAAEAAREQNERTPIPYIEGGGGKNLRFKAKRGGRLELLLNLRELAKQPNVRSQMRKPTVRRQSPSKRLLKA